MAWHVLLRVDRDRAYADLALNTTLRALELPRRERALATELCYGTLRLRGRIDAALGQVLERELARVEPAVLNMLRLGAYQLLFLERVHPGIAVSESVDLTRALGFERAAGFVNAVLRQLAQRAQALCFPDLDEDPKGYLVQWGSLPEWLAERWLEELGATRAAALAEASLAPPPRTVRVTERADPDDVAKRLRGRRCRYAPRGVTDLERDPVQDPGFDRGDFIVQDEAAQLPALLLGCRSGETAVDCCAAPGTKAVQLAELVGPSGEVIALDASQARLGLIHRNAARLRLENLRILQRDATRGFDLRGQQRFPRILVDAPCSGLGVLRRNPDARWRLEPDDIPRAAERQVALLRSAARYVGEDGSLVYSVCTQTPEETTGVLSRFLEHEPGFRVDDPRPHLPAAAAALVGVDDALATSPDRHVCDGFWAVRLVHA